MKANDVSSPGSSGASFFYVDSKPHLSLSVQFQEGGLETVEAIENLIHTIDQDNSNEICAKEVGLVTTKDRADYHLQREELELALEYYTKFLQEAEIKFENWNVGNALKGIARVFMGKEQWAFAAKIFNCALAIYPKEHLKYANFEKSVLALLADLDSRFLYRRCGIEIRRDEIDSKMFFDRRDKLASFRQGIREKLKEDHLPQVILKEFSGDIAIFLDSLIKDAKVFLGEPPCEFAILGLGSLARNEMSPYSDFEFAILINITTPEILDYFKKLVEWLEIQIINLGETELKILDHGYESPVPRGFSFDDGGNTPLGKQEYVLLIQTPEDLAQLQSEKYYEEDLILSNTLKDAGFLVGNKNLFQKYVRSMQTILDSCSKNQGRIIRQERAVHIINGHLIEFEPQINEKKELIPIFNIKDELYRLPNFLITALGDYYGIRGQDFCIKIDALVEKEILSEEGASNLKRALNSILNLRIRCHLYYGRECDEVYHPAMKRSDKLDENERVFILSQEDIDQITGIYQVILPLHKAFKKTFKGEEVKSLNTEVFFDSTLQTQGMTFEKLFDFNQAKISYASALALNPDDEEVHLRLAKLLFETADYSDAMVSLNKAIILAKSNTHQESLAVALNLNGLIFQAQGNIKDAIKCYDKALEINRSLQNFNVISNLVNLGVAWNALGEESKALRCYEEAFHYSQDQHGSESHSTADILSNMGEVYRASGNLQKAIECHSKALNIDRKLYENDNPVLAIKLNNLGLDLKLAGQVDSAIGYYEQALRIDQKVYGSDHPLVAIRLNNLALAWQALKKPKQAIAYLKRALVIDKKVYGDEHPNVALRLSNLGMALIDLGESNQAIQHLEEALRIDKKNYGNDHPDVATDYVNLGTIYKSIGKTQDAYFFFKEALEIDVRLFGENDARVCRDLMLIDSIWSQLNQREKVLYFEKMIEISKARDGDNYPDLARDLNNLGLAYRDLGDFDKALIYLEEALQIDLSLYGPEHTNVSVRHFNLGQTYQKLRNFKKAFTYLSAALQIDEKIYGAEHQEVASDLNGIGVTWLEAGDLLKATIYFKRALKIYKKIFGDQHPKVQLVEGNLNIALQSLRKNNRIVLNSLESENTRLLAEPNNQDSRTCCCTLS